MQLMQHCFQILLLLVVRNHLRLDGGYLQAVCPLWGMRLACIGNNHNNSNSSPILQFFSCRQGSCNQIIAVFCGPPVVDWIDVTQHDLQAFHWLLVIPHIWAVACAPSCSVQVKSRFC